MEIIIRSVKHNDLDEIINIEKKCFSLPWLKNSFEKELLNQLAYYECAELNGKVIGYMGMWKVIDEGHITNVAVLPEYRNMGVASLLIEKMIQVCICSEINTMTLEVRESNKTAKKLYEKYGFEAVGIRPKYYQKPLENAVIMWKKIE